MATSDELCWMPASQMAPAIKRRKLSPVEVMKAVLARIERLNPQLNAFVTLTADQAIKDARAAERAVMKKGAKLGPLHGVPYSDQGSRDHEGHPHHVRHAALCRQRAGRGRADGGAHAGRGRDPARQDQHADDGLDRRDA